MSSDPDLPRLAPPPRRLTPSVIVSDETSRPGSSRREIKAYFSELNVEEAAQLSRIVAQLPSIVKGVRKAHLDQTKREMRAAFTLTTDAIRRLNAVAWNHENWREVVLQELPCISLEKAISGCESGPWDLHLDLLVLPHQGRSHVPAFQFEANGSPSATWLTLISVLKAAKSGPSNWDILAWLLRPHPILKDNFPLSIHMQDPQRVRQLAHSAKSLGLV